MLAVPALKDVHRCDGANPGCECQTGITGGLFTLPSLGAADLPAIAAVMRRYASADLQLADATLAHLAERENIRTVFTTDRRDFSIIRLKRNRSLRLIPDLG
jgi:uncharacterized protein